MDGSPVSIERVPLVRPQPPVRDGAGDEHVRWEYAFPVAGGREAAIGLVMDGPHPRSTVVRQWGDGKVVDTDLGYIDFAAPFRGGVGIGFDSECMFRSYDGGRIFFVVGRDGSIDGDFASLVHRKVPDYGLTAMGVSDDGIVMCTEDRRMFVLPTSGAAVRHQVPTQLTVLAVTQRDERQVAVVVRGRDKVMVMVGSDPSDWKPVADLTEPWAVGYRSTEPGVIKASSGRDHVQRITLE